MNNLDINKLEGLNRSSECLSNDYSQHITDYLKTWNLDDLEKLNITSMKGKHPFISLNIAQNYFNNYNSVPEEYYLLKNEVISLISSFNKNGIIPMIGIYPYISDKFNDGSFLSTLEDLIEEITSVARVELLIDYDKVSLDQHYIDFVNKISINDTVISIVHDNEVLEALQISDGILDLSNNAKEMIMKAIENNVYTEDLINFKISKLNVEVEKMESEKPNSDLVYESMILLKNTDNLLPLSKTSELDILGDKTTYTFKSDLINYKRGYEVGKTVLKQGSNIVETTKRTIVLLGTRSKDKLEIDPSCLQLLKKAKGLNKKVVLIVDEAKCLNKDVDELADVIIVSNLNNTKEIENVLYGKNNPTGRLYESISKRNDTYQLYNAKNYGFHYFDKKISDLLYPFGYGLSYSNINYTDFKYTTDGISFTIENNSSKASSEVIQIYAGSSFSSKELVYFERLPFEKNEAKEIIIPVDITNEKFIFIAKDAKTVLYSFELATLESKTYDNSLESKPQEEVLNVVEEEPQEEVLNVVEEEHQEQVLNKVEGKTVEETYTEEQKEIIAKVLETEEQLSHPENLDIANEVANRKLLNPNDETISKEFLNNYGKETVEETADIEEENYEDYDKEDNLEQDIPTEESEDTYVEVKDEKKTVVLPKRILSNDAPLNENTVREHHIMSKRSAYLLLFVIDICLLVSFIMANILSDNQTIKSISIILIIIEIVVSFFIMLMIKKNYNTKDELKEIIKTFSVVENEKPVEEELEETIEEDESIESNKVVSFGFTNLTVKLNFLDLDFQEIIQNLYNFILLNRILIDINQVRQIVASLTYTKVIFIKSNNPKLQDELINVIAKYFGGNPVGVAIQNSISDFRNLFLLETNLENVNNLAKINGIVNIAYLKYDQTNPNEFLKEFLPYTKYNDQAFNTDTVVKLSKNLWYFIDLNEHDIADIADIYNDDCSLINLSLKDNLDENIETDVIIESITYAPFSLLVYNNKETVYISEELWRNLDHIEEFINEKKTFKLTNPLINQIEDFVKTLVEADLDLTVAFDLAIATKLVPIIKNMNLSAEAIAEIIQELENTFSYENIANTIKTIKEM